MFILRNKFLILIFCAILFFIVRAPVYFQKMQGEDGIFAALILKQPPNKEYTMLARIDGVEIYDANVHPALNYEILKAAGKIFFVENYWQKLSPFWITALLRFITSLYMFVIFMGAVVLCLRISKQQIRNLCLTAVVVAFISPLAIASSVYLQIDNTSGALLLGLAALVFATTKENALLMALAGLLIGFGKHEWAFAFFAAFSGTLFLQLIFSKKIFFNKNIILAFVFCLLGCYLNYLYLPSSYAAALHLTQGGQTPGASADTSMLSWLATLPKRLFWAGPLLIAQIFIANNFLKSKIKIQHLFLYIFSLMLVAGYMLPSALPHSRYFAPALVVIAALLIITFKNYWLNPTTRDRKILISVAGVVCLLSLFYVLAKTKAALIDKFVDASEWAQYQDQSCVMRLDGIDFIGTQDFVFAGASKESAQEIINKYSKQPKTVCSN